MTTHAVRIDSSLIRDTASFHAVCVQVFGFPSFYGRSADAWIDCMRDLRNETGMTSILLGINDLLTIQLAGVEDLKTRCPDVFDQLTFCASAVNQHFLSRGQAPAIALVLC